MIWAYGVWIRVLYKLKEIKLGDALATFNALFWGSPTHFAKVGRGVGGWWLIDFTWQIHLFFNRCTFYYEIFLLLPLVVSISRWPQSIRRIYLMRIVFKKKK